MQRSSGLWRQIGPVAGFEGGGARVVEVDDRKLAVGRVGDRYFAVDNTCPHARASLAAGEMRGQTIVCPLHGWDFNVFTGKCFRFSEKIVSHSVRVQNRILEVRLSP